MKKLKVGNIVSAIFLGVVYKCEVIEVTEKDMYKLRTTSGMILPSVQWKKLMKKNSPWYIEALISTTTNSKSIKSKDTMQNTTDKVELKKAIKNQKNFIRGQVKK
ncbi:MAG: hypothetical protein H8E55_57475 [Pelagibacterales bacterium]|nr:hypothetical protein [Pelagibacterales bacterium]